MRGGGLCVIAAIVLLSGCTTTAPESRAEPTPAPTASIRLPTTQPLAFRSPIRAIFQDSRRRYWIGSDKEGVTRLDAAGFTTFTQVEGLPSNQIRSIQEDADGAIWVGTGHGVARIDGDRVTAFPIAIDAPATAAGPLDNGILWFGAGFHHGAQHRSGDGVAYVPLPPPPPGGSPGVTAITHGKDGSLWIASYGAVYRHDADSGFSELDGLAPGLMSGGELHIRSILADSRGTLWIGNNGLGVLRFDGATTTDFTRDMGLMAPGGVRDGGPSPQGTLEHVFAIEEDQAGDIWFGDRDTGVWRYDGQAVHHYGVAEGLPTNSVWDIHTDRDGNVLVALDGGVVRRFVEGRFVGVFGGGALVSPRRGAE